jgi:hypothetical protein
MMKPRTKGDTSTEGWYKRAVGKRREDGAFMSGIVELSLITI